jgi:hypothetical protein
MVEMPGGSYAVAVNGVETSFDWSGAGEAQAPRGAEAGELQPVQIKDVRVAIGVGSPIPVDVLVSGAWPGLCSQVARIEQRIEGREVEISLLASPDTPDCPPDAVGLPFRIALPLNMVEMRLGAYTVWVNGVEAAFEWNAQPGEVTEEPAGSGAAPVAFIGQDGNVWVLEAPGADPRQVTQDAVSGEPGVEQPSETVMYYFLALSSDGQMVAYRRDAGMPVESGMSYESGLWVSDLATGESRQVLDRTPAMFAWKPGTHLLAYGLGVDEGREPGILVLGGCHRRVLLVAGWDADRLRPADVCGERRGAYLPARAAGW